MPDPFAALSSEPSVAILLGTYQGEAFLAAQLDSIEQQQYRRWTLWASDDGSRDRTRAILEDYRARWGDDRLRIVDGPRRGYAANFLTLLCDDALVADYFAYCDQDDLWEPDKLGRAVGALHTLSADTPALYASRTRLIDARDAFLGYSPRFGKAPAFANALVQSIGGGNTQVFNRAARRILGEAGVVDVVAHDWWTYLAVSGCGGAVLYDARPSVRYRQHAANQMGANRRLAAQIRRARQLLGGDFREWNDRNLAALQTLRPRLTEDSRRRLDAFAAAREAALVSRLTGFGRAGIYRQTALGNLGLFAAALLGKL